MTNITKPNFSSYSQGTMQLPRSAFDYLAAHPQPALFLVIFMVVLRPRETSIEYLAALVAVPIALLAYWWFVPLRRMRLCRGIHHISKDLPWFVGEPVTCHPLPQHEELAAVLTKHDYTACTLDGEHIHSWQDLATALQSHAEPMQLPSDPHQKVRALLMNFACKKPRKRAVIWQNAGASARHNPALVAAFASEWAAHMTHLPIGLLVFVDLPEAAEAKPDSEDTDQHFQQHERAPQPDRSILKDAPDGSWWQPQPGELT